MRSFLKPREVLIHEMTQEIYSQYPKETILDAIEKLLFDVKKVKGIDRELATRFLESVLNKTETYSVMLSIMELEKRTTFDVALQALMQDPSYNQHRALAINICDMYSTGATSFFGYMDCMFRSFFPQKHPKSFLAKGICALVASVAEVIVTGEANQDYERLNLDLLATRGVEMIHMSSLVLELQKPYNPHLTLEECEEHVRGVLRKQQTYHTIHLCVTIDHGVEKKEFGDQFQAIVGADEGLYGIDETVNTSVSKMYGMIAITNFGYLDKSKPGIIGELDSHQEDGTCNTFIDDTVCAIVSAACARLAHNHAMTQSKPKKI
jgi:phosphatidylglycerophosphatase A